MQNVLKLTSPMTHGPAVKRLQELGDLLGFDTGPNDGIFGKDTERAVLAIQAHLGLKQDGVCGPITWAAILTSLDKLDYGPIAKNFIDIRGTHAMPKLYSHERPWSEITGVTIHQTGCRMPESPDGWRTLNAHCGITTAGTIILVNEFTDMIWHAQGLSHATIGIEISGNFHGIEGDERTLWRGGGEAARFSLDQHAALVKLFEFIDQEAARNDARIVEIHAHRQSSKDRPADPGSAIWASVQEEIAWRGATDGGPDWKVGTGKPIPREWNAAYTRGYFK